MTGEKTEKATPKKRKESRKEGEVVKSIELNNSFSLIAAVLILKIYGSSIIMKIVNSFNNMLSSSPTLTMNTDTVKKLFTNMAVSMFEICAPVVFVILITGVLVNCIQTGFMFNLQRLKVKPDRINPIESFKKMFSRTTVFDMVKTIIKTLIVGILFWFDAKEFINKMPQLMYYELFKSIGHIFNTLFNLCLDVILALTVIAVVDYFFRHFDYEKRIMMTKQEVKEEMKKTEGDPQLKSRIKSKQTQMARMRMMREVPKADVVVANPTHYAVALKYDKEKNSSPVVTAKGKNLVAEKIKQIAVENNVKIVENKFVAQTLYKTTQIGEQIPAHMFKAVAEILAYVYSLKQSKVRR